MKLLLDTHAFLWLNDDMARLSETVKALCSSGEHEFYLSTASPWEIQIKSQLGKLTLAIPIGELVSKNQLENNIQILPIELSHIGYLEKLPQHHKDPFDRIIIAQAIIEDMMIVTVDHAFSNYSVQVVW
ncbi:type II toxin-antitoxin system VapC family toxin [Candidatus Methylobacter oryzae]|uniref:Type II toxin-antitoxin system VapC family toxin n=1 Tax=Candidatus Methylobacter oryzae TaxID=2497749 RepID=A0ABY3CDQ0_9GAMM|nr:type II toxin-antitoxin system VapC family toxin [Candidatus Methylobacter oryzae]TRX00783.1 type II toxin-antitoxin system VapC family toxin [Candidatus Methylobacter oryzae]